MLRSLYTQCPIFPLRWKSDGGSYHGPKWHEKGECPMRKAWRASSAFLIIGLVLFLLPWRSADAQTPDPTLLPVATTSQVPLTAA